MQLKTLRCCPESGVDLTRLGGGEDLRELPPVPADAELLPLQDFDKPGNCLRGERRVCVPCYLTGQRIGGAEEVRTIGLPGDGHDVMQEETFAYANVRIRCPAIRASLGHERYIPTR